MNKTIYLLNIGDYAPELTELTYPTIYGYAERIGAEVVIITERKFRKWPVVYEKLQIHELAKRRGDDWAIYIDSDALIHPELPDVTDLIPMDTVAHNGHDFSPLRFADDEYFRRDGRHIGSCNWFAVASSWCFDLWRPLDDMTPKEVEKRITLTMPERAAGLEVGHLADDFALARNIARFGLKFTTLTDIWPAVGLAGSNFFFHEYLLKMDDTPTGTFDDEGNEIIILGKVSAIKLTMKNWGI